MQVNPPPFSYDGQILFEDEMLNSLLRTPQVDCRLLYIQQHRLNVRYRQASQLQSYKGTRQAAE
jgi:hypothetical protein